MRRARPVIVMSVLALLAVSPLAADRVYDRDVKKLIDQADSGLNRFMGRMSSEAKSAKVTRDGVEVDISNYLADLKTSGNKLDSRFASGAAGTEALDFLKRAKFAEEFWGRHPGFSGADAEWSALSGTLGALAGAYQIDWKSDPAGWRPVRMDDQELATLAGGLDQQLKSYGKELNTAARAAKVDSSSLSSLTGLTNGAREAAKGFSTTVKRKAPAGSSLQGVQNACRALADKASALGVSGSGTTNQSLQGTLTKLGSTFGQ